MIMIEQNLKIFVCKRFRRLSTNHFMECPTVTFIFFYVLGQDLNDPGYRISWDIDSFTQGILTNGEFQFNSNPET